MSRRLFITAVVLGAATRLSEFSIGLIPVSSFRSSLDALWAPVWIAVMCSGILGYHLSTQPGFDSTDPQRKRFSAIFGGGAVGYATIAAFLIGTGLESTPPLAGGMVYAVLLGSYLTLGSLAGVYLQHAVAGKAGVSPWLCLVVGLFFTFAGLISLSGYGRSVQREAGYSLLIGGYCLLLFVLQRNG